MYNVEVRYNDSEESLYCSECKHPINLGEKYLIVHELLYNEGEEICLIYHPDCIPESSDEDGF